MAFRVSSKREGLESLSLLEQEKAEFIYSILEVFGGKLSYQEIMKMPRSFIDALLDAIVKNKEAQKKAFNGKERVNLFAVKKNNQNVEAE